METEVCAEITPAEDSVQAELSLSLRPPNTWSESSTFFAVVFSLASFSFSFLGGAVFRRAWGVIQLSCIGLAWLGLAACTQTGQNEVQSSWLLLTLDLDEVLFHSGVSAGGHNAAADRGGNLYDSNGRSSCAELHWFCPRVEGHCRIRRAQSRC